MTVESGGSRVCSEQYLASGLLTFAALLLVFAAFDDITTGSGTTVRMEYAWLVACAAGLIFVAVRLLRAGHQLLGGTSVLAVGAGVWAQRAIGPGIVLDLIRFGGRVDYVDLVSLSFVEESLQVLGGIRISIRRSLVAAGERPVAI